MADIRQSINLPPDEKVEYFRAKGYATQAHWDELWQEDHNRAFTVTKMMNGDLLEATRASLDKVLSSGGTFEQWKADIVPKMVAAGWHGRVQDPAITGVDHPVYIGEGRLRTIYDTNLRIARAAGKWKRIQSLKGMAPYLLYDAINDRRTRPLHRKWGGLDTGKPIILPVDHPAWSIYYPPCGWGCRCGVIQLSDRSLRSRNLRVTSDEDLRALGWLAADGTVGGGRAPWRRPDGTVEQVPAGIDPGFGYNPGVNYMAGLVPPPLTGPIQVPHIQPDPMPPLPPARVVPVDTLLPRDTPPQQAIEAFLATFGNRNSDGAVVTRDVIGDPLVIDPSFFYRGGVPGDPTTFKLVDKDRVAGIRLLAQTLDDPDGIWWVWEEVKTPAGTRHRLTRRYVARFQIGGRDIPTLIVVEMGKSGWKGVTAVVASSPRYANKPQVRGGVLAYRRP